MTNDDLISYLLETKANFIFCFSSLVLLIDDEGLKVLGQIQAHIKGGYTLPLADVAIGLRKWENKQHVFSALGKTYLKCLIRDSFELIKEYCEESNQMPLLGQESWYHFARILRNAFSHRNMFVFSKYDQKILPVVWKQKVIAATMEDTDVKLDFFGFDDGLELFADMLTFVQQTLN